MVPGLDRHLGQSVSPFIPVTLWVLTSALLSAPWAIVWTSERHVDYLWRVPLALLATAVPPLGIIGLISPLTAAGYLFPGTAWFGLMAIALLPGILLSTHSLDLRRCSAVLLVVTPVGVGLAIGGRVVSTSTKSIPGWMAVNTYFGDVSRPFQAFVAARYIQSKAAAVSARVLIFPEAVVPRCRTQQRRSGTSRLTAAALGAKFWLSARGSRPKARANLRIAKGCASCSHMTLGPRWMFLRGSISNPCLASKAV